VAVSARDTSAVPDYLAKLRLDGRVFVVLGGGNGIGRQTCHALAQAGAQIVCVDRDAELARAVADEVRGAALDADVTKRSEVERVFAEAKKQGAVRGVVDIVGMPVLGPLAELDDAKWQSQLDLVLTHAFLALQIGSNAIAAAGGGSMVFVGSMSGVTKIPGQVAYGTAKAALHQLVAASANELGPSGIRVNAVAPGFARTPRLNTMISEAQWEAIGGLTALGHAADPSEIASAILFLTSDLASHVTGQVLLADGGITGTVVPPKIWKT
jgi:NAD(P)-dependent dehydrogenase (short-subunit alcohol dehydrogenase family)